MSRGTANRGITVLVVISLVAGAMSGVAIVQLTRSSDDAQVPVGAIKTVKEKNETIETTAEELL
ncbi:hypothetical protein SCB29_41985, partial [Paraburkholderia sp. SIMBA_055]